MERGHLDETISAIFGCSVIRLHTLGTTSNGFIVYFMSDTLLIMSYAHIMHGFLWVPTCGVFLQQNDLSSAKIEESQHICNLVMFFHRPTHCAHKDIPRQNKELTDNYKDHRLLAEDHLLLKHLNTNEFAQTT
uniref:Uncharacterized protein n=1 Tax=Leersia perrieri TaxID=77586 RepID=A0A0D9XM52_9ORYZ